MNIDTSTKDYMFSQIEHVVATFKDRVAGSDAERSTQDYFKTELKKYADGAKEHEFDVYPNAILGTIPLVSIMMIVAAVCFTFTNATPVFAVVALVLAICCFLAMLLQVVLNIPILDAFFPKKVSKNIIALRKSKNEPKRRIVLGASADAPREATFSRKFGNKFSAIYIALLTILPLLSAIIYLVFILVMKDQAFGQTVGWKTASYISLSFIVVYVLGIFFTNWDTVPDGATQNLSGSAVVLGAMKELSEQDIRFDDTEVWAFISGSNCSGYKGAKAFAKGFAPQLDEVETVFISFDRLYDENNFKIATKGSKATAKTLLTSVAKELDIQIKTEPRLFSISDINAFGKDISSARFSGTAKKDTMSFSSSDTLDALNKEALEKGLSVALEAVNAYDAMHK